AEDRAFAHATGAVEQGQPRPPEVGRDDLRLSLAAEEELGVLLVVRHQTFVGAGHPGGTGHAPPPTGGSARTRASSSLIYSFRSALTKSTSPRSFQNSSSRGLRRTSTAHDF